MALKIGGKKNSKNKSARHKSKRISKKKRMYAAKKK